MNNEDPMPAKIDWRASVERIINSGHCANMPPDMDEKPTDHECTFGWRPKPAYAILVKRGMDKTKAMRYVNKAYYEPCPICTAHKFLKRHHAEEMTWETFNEDTNVGIFAEQIRAWQPRTVEQIMLIHGKDTERHNGKTHAMIAAAHALILAGVPVSFWNAADLRIENRFEPEMRHLGAFKGWLFIDDLGRENSQAAYRESIDREIDYRWRSFVPTVISSKLDHDALATRYPRLMDRMNGGVMIEWAAESYRRAA